jgi:PRD1 phage membrane DNA delivery
MSDQIIAGVITVFTAVVGVAIIAVLVGSNSQTASVINAAGRAFGGALGVAVSPVTGQGVPTYQNTLTGGGVGYALA